MTPAILLLIGVGCSPVPGRASEPVTPVVALAPSPPSSARLTGICDGSAAVARPEGGEWLVAYDEDTSLHRFDADGREVGRIPLAGLLGTSATPEYDLEGAAFDPASGWVWWVGSHGRDGDGRDAPARRLLFATSMPMGGQGSVQIHAKPVDLTGALMAHPDTRSRLSAEVMARGPKRGGLNIEGLAMHPSGGVMLGLRSPLGSEDGMRGPALLVHLAPVRAAGASELEVREVLAVDLADRGVRSLARDGEGWLALAGPVGREGGFDLYRIGSDGRVLRVDVGEALDGLNPEALVQDAGRWWVISDDGKVDRPDPTAGDGARGCDKIRKKTAEGSAHASVYARRVDLGPLAVD